MTPQEKKELDFVIKVATKVLLATIVISLVLITLIIINL